MMKIIEIRGDSPEIICAVEQHCRDNKYGLSFMDRYTMTVYSLKANALTIPTVYLWFGVEGGTSKTIALNKLDKELCDGKDTRG